MALPAELALGSRGQTGDEQRRAGGGDDSEGAHLVLPVVVSVVVFVAPLAGPAQPDVTVERLHVEPRAPRAEREAEAVLRRVRDADREARVEFAVERGDRHRRVRLLRYHEGHVAVVGRKTVVTGVRDRPFVAYVAAHGADVHVGGCDSLEADVAAYRARRDLA